MRNIRNEKRLQRESSEETLSHFETWMRAEGYAERTVKDYIFNVGHFAKWLCSNGMRDFTGLVPPMIAEYQAVVAARPGRHGQPLAASTRAHVASAILTLGKFLVATGRAKRNPAEGIHLPRTPKNLPDNVMTMRETEQILAVPRLDNHVELRNRALMELLYATGLRQKEALDLDLKDVDLSALEVRVVEGKGGRGRIVPLCRASADVLAAYLAEARPALAAGGDSSLFFLSRRGRRVDPSRMLKTFKRYAVRAGIARPVGFHTFRHSAATHLLKRGAGIRYIQEFLGHRSLTSTQIYTHVAISDLKAAHARFHPREKMDV